MKIEKITTDQRRTVDRCRSMKPSNRVTVMWSLVAVVKASPAKIVITIRYSTISAVPKMEWWKT